MDYLGAYPLELHSLMDMGCLLGTIVETTLNYQRISMSTVRAPY